ncbi:MAG: hypothetical protein P4L99_22475 [Chthoniobacter sp.]|nr:hypothetical protein [Chthoniobacter sp.]
MTPADLLVHLRTFVAREKIALPPASIAVPEIDAYPPFGKYLLELAKDSKPERVAEDLFVAVARDVARLKSIPQVNVGDGFVDFLVGGEEQGAGGVVIELKPLFTKYNLLELRRTPLKPANHRQQVKKYLRKHEYVVLTDLRTACLYSARDFFVTDSFFAELPFADLLERVGDQLDLLDVLRQAEDAQEKPDLDRQFFEDLKEWFAAFQNVHWKKSEDAAELTILLLNKLIFAKTLEDHGLVPYRFLQDEYDQQEDRWETKGPHRVVQAFLEALEPFFDEYYDTELFERRIWHEIDRDHENLARFCNALKLVLGISKWDRVLAQRGVVNYNYRTINEDIFGKSYEMFLAANRKDEGIYYTPATITTPMAESMVASLFGPLVDEILAAIDKDRADFETARALMAKLARLHLIDTASGSGGFLIKVLRAIWVQYERLTAGLEWLDKVNLTGDLFDLPVSIREAALFREERLFLPTQRRKLVAAILLRHIFAIDKDAGALEVAKTNVWKEAVKLTPGDYNFRRLPGEAQKILPNLELNFICADSLVDLPLDRQVAWLAEYHRHELQELASLRAEYLANPSDHSSLEDALKLRLRLRANLREHFQTESLPEPASCLPLIFFPCWFDFDGTPRENGGFDGIIGNPPWEAVKPVRKEFAKIDKYSMSVVDFDAWFATKLKEDDDFAKRWAAYQEFYENYKVYLSRRFIHQGTGDWNLFKLFIEADLDLLRHHGRLSLLVPSSIQTDEGCTALRKLFITVHTLDEITSFENRGYKDLVKGEEKTIQIFPDVDSRFKFGFFKVVKGEPTVEGHTFDARFYLHSPQSVAEAPIKYSVEMIRRFSPQNLSLMEFRSEADYALCGKIRGEHKLLAETGCVFRRELHPKDDVDFFHKRTQKKLAAEELPIFEGKMISQYRLDNAPNSFFAVGEEVHLELRRKELSRLLDFVRDSGVETIEGVVLPKKRSEWPAIVETIFDQKAFKLDYEFERMAYRRVGRSTDERTIIAAVLGAKIILTDTLTYRVPSHYDVDAAGTLSQKELPASDAYVHAALLNSLVLNYYIRSKISATVNMFYVYELPIPEFTTRQRERLAKSAAKLSKKSDDVKERAALEVFIARELYGLDAADWEHLTGTFTFGGESDSKAELDEIIRLSREMWAKN